MASGSFPALSHCAEFLDGAVYLPGSLVSGSTEKFPQDPVSFPPRCGFYLVDSSWLCLHLGLVHYVCTAIAVAGGWLMGSAKKNYSASGKEDLNLESFKQKHFTDWLKEKKKVRQKRQIVRNDRPFVQLTGKGCFVEKLLSFKVFVEVCALSVLNCNSG